MTGSGIINFAGTEVGRLFGGGLEPELPLLPVRLVNLKGAGFPRVPFSDAFSAAITACATAS